MSAACYLIVQRSFVALIPISPKKADLSINPLRTLRELWVESRRNGLVRIRLPVGLNIDYLDRATLFSRTATIRLAVNK